jgi:transcriptional regulator with XRE-family HTH domain
VCAPGPRLSGAFGSALRAARLEHNLAQEALAHSAGVERSHVGKIERGEHMPTMAIALKLAVALGLSLSELVVRMEAELKRGGRAAPKR